MLVLTIASTLKSVEQKRQGSRREGSKRPPKAWGPLPGSAGGNSLTYLEGPERMDFLPFLGQLGFE